MTDSSNDGQPTEEEVEIYYEEDFWLQTDWDKKIVTPIVWRKVGTDTADTDID